MQVARKLRLAAAVVLGLLIAARMLVGPFQIAGVAVNAPLNLEGLFGLLVLSAVMLQARQARVGTFSATNAFLALNSGNQSRNLLLIPFTALALAAVVSYVPALHVGFVSDDFILIKMARDSSLASLFHAFTSAGGDGFYRPMGYLSVAFDHLWAGVDPVLWHLSATLLHLLNSALVVVLATRLGLSRVGAVLAGGLFALHGTHLEASVWIAGRFDLLATLFTLTGLLLSLGSLKRGQWSWRSLAGLLVMVLALLSKEAAYVFPILLVSLAAGPPEDGPSGRIAVWRRTWPYFVATVLLFAFRAALVGGIGGYRIAGTGEASFFSLKLGTTLKVLLVRLWTSLFFPINWSSDPSVSLAASGILAMAAMLYVAYWSRPSSVFWRALLCLIISILPPLHLLGGAADLSGGRLLYLPSVWFCILLATALDGLPEGIHRPRIVWALAGCLLLFHFCALEKDLREWTVTGQKVDAACQTAGDMVKRTGGAVAVFGLPRSIHGVPAFANGFSECVELSSGRRDSVNFLESASVAADGPMLLWDNDTQTLRVRSTSPPATPGDTR